MASTSNLAVLQAMATGKMPEAPENLVAHAAPGVEREKAAMLEAIAQHGTAGYEEFNLAKQAQQQAATGGVLQATANQPAAAQAPTALIEEIQRLYNQTLDPISQATTMSQQAHSREMERIRAANDAYMQQLGAAIPAIQAETQADVDKMRIAFEHLLRMAQEEAAAKARGGGGGGGGRRRSSGKKSSGGGGGKTVKRAATYEDFRNATKGMSNDQILKAAKDLGRPDWGRAAMNGMIIPGLPGGGASKGTSKATTAKKKGGGGGGSSWGTPAKKPVPQLGYFGF